jgi:hypothetical protein
LTEFIESTPAAGAEEQIIEILLGTVAEVLPDGLRVKLDGSDEATAKVYKCNASVIFASGDRVKITKHSGTLLIDYVIGSPGEPAAKELPTGGTTGQLLAKSSDDDYAVSWVDAPHGLPSGGSSGQMLAKSNNTNYAVAWVDAPHGLPSGGSSGQVLAKSSNANYAVSWVDTPHGLPTGGSSGQVLAKSSNANYAVSWVDISVSKLGTGTYTVELSGTVLTPSSSNIALGSSSKKWGDLYAEGTVSLGKAYSNVTLGALNSYLGFFGHAPAARQTVANTATVATLITALKAYGLIL